MGQSHYKISKRTGEIPRVIGGSSQLLVESPRPLGLDKGKLLKNWGRGLDEQASRTLLYNYLPKYYTAMYMAHTVSTLCAAFLQPPLSKRPAIC